MQTTVTHEPSDRVVVDKRSYGTFWHERGKRSNYEWLQRLELWEESVAHWKEGTVEFS